MYYIYFSYVAILASLMLYDCYHKNQPRWWAFIVLFVPVTTPYFIFKSRKESGFILFMVFLLTFSAVAGVEFFLYSNYMEKNKYSHLSPVTRQMLHLCDELKTSTITLDHALGKLENLSKVQSRVKEIRTTIEFIDQLRLIMIENQDDINRLAAYTSDYKSFFNRKKFEWVFNIQKFYTNRTVIQHYKSLQKYLDNFAELLKYTHVNFYNITEYKSTQHLKNYDQYYLRYRRAVDAHNRFNVKRIDFQNSVLKKHPDIKPYLPGERQTDTFKLWK